MASKTTGLWRKAKCYATNTSMRLFDNTSRATSARRGAACLLAAAQRAPGRREAFVSYLAQQLDTYVGQRVLQLNAGAGGLCRGLLPRERYVACAPDAVALAELKVRLGEREGLSFVETRAPFAQHLPRLTGGFDTIVWTRETAFSQLDQLALRHLRTTLAPHGRILLLVTGAQEPFVDLEAVAHKAQLQLRQTRHFDGIATPMAQAQRLMNNAGLGTPWQALKDLLRPFAGRWDERWPFAGRHALGVLVHLPKIAEAACLSDGSRSLRLICKDARS